MVALLVAHVEVEVEDGTRSENEAFYASALGAAICSDPEPDDALVVNCGLTQLIFRPPPEAATAPSSEAASLLAEAPPLTSSRDAAAAGAAGAAAGCWTAELGRVGWSGAQKGLR